MILLRCVQARAAWLWGLLVLVTLSGCSTPYQFRYHYDLVAPANSSDGIEDERVRVRVTPTAEAGVLQLTVFNKSSQPLTIAWDQTRYVDPFGAPRPTIEVESSGVFGPRPWPVDGTRVMPGETFQTSLRPAGLRTSRVRSLSPYAGQLDMHVPPTEDLRTPPRASDRLTANPFTITRSTGGEMHISTSPQPLLPASGTTPSLGQSYKNRDFRFIVALRFDTRVVPYAFTFRITDVEVQQSTFQAP